jgi:hypothetical protein
MGELFPIILILLFFGGFVGIIVWAMKKSGQGGSEFIVQPKTDDTKDKPAKK